MIIRQLSAVLAGTILAGGLVVGSSEDETRAIIHPDYPGVGKEFAKAREKTAIQTPVASPPEVPGPRYSYLGVTLWRDRPVRKSDPPFSRSIVYRPGSNAKVEVTPERILSSTLLSPGDRLQITVESARAGYLYVVNREVYRDGTKGAPTLIFPHVKIAGGQNRVGPGIITKIPEGSERLDIDPASGDLVSEELTFFITPQPIQGMIASGESLELDPAEIAKWEKEWKSVQVAVDDNKGVGRTLTREEAAARNDASMKMPGRAALPQTLFRVTSKDGAHVLVSMELKRR